MASGSSNGESIEPLTSRQRDFGNRLEHLDSNMDNENALQRIKTAGSISISPELFEKLYLSPRDSSAKDGIRSFVANPTPIALCGFLLSLTPLSCDLMGWRGAGQANGSAGIGSYFFFGGLLMVLGAFGEFVTGNTFPCVVFASFGAFWLTYAATLQDSFYNAQGNYALGANGSPLPAAQAAADFYNAFAFFLLWMGVLCFIYMVCSLRTNVVFFVIFFTLVFTFALLAGGFWQLAEGNAAAGGRLVKAGAAFAFVTCVAGWWIFAAILLASLDFPLVLPVGDLSAVIKGKREKPKVTKEKV